MLHNTSLIEDKVEPMRIEKTWRLMCINLEARQGCLEIVDFTCLYLYKAVLSVYAHFLTHMHTHTQSHLGFICPTLLLVATEQLD